ncbi:MAG: acetate--CoA ligase family protein [Alphaproteobacteria bacterium]|nr:acetate--CoA ligase family protein [Alphaproteobacteria bacterium]
MGDLSLFFEARRVAVVGASSDPMRIGGRPVAALKRAWLAGDPDRALYPVNPNRREIQGLPAYESASAIGAPVDLGVIAVPPDGVVEALQDCARAGCRAAILFTSGFAELGAAGRAREEEVVRTARALKVRLLGPNCLGLIDLHRGLLATFTDAVNYDGHRAGSVGVASQSGAVMSQLMMLARRRRVGLSKAISTGNEGDVDLAEAVAYLAADAQTAQIVCYAETARDGPALADALSAARRAGKPVLMIKAGRTEAGRSAALSHTGALAGTDRVFDAVMRQCGAVRVRDLQEAIDIAYVAVRRAPPSALARLGVVTISGGAGVMLADEAAAGGLSLPPLPPAAAARLREAAPYASAANPLDTTAQAVNDLPVWAACVETMLDGTYDAVLMSLAYFGESARMYGPILDAVRPLQRPDGPLLISCTPHDAPNAARAEEAGFLVFDDPTAAIRALAGWSRAGRAAAPQERASDGRAAPTIDPPTASMTEAAALRLVAEAGVPTAPFRLVATARQAAAALDEIGAPMVLKIASPDLPHKSDVGGVRLGLRTPAEAAAAFEAMTAQVSSARPDARLEGAVAAKQLSGGVELILGSQIDPTFGLMIMVGAGGVLTELFEDVVFRRAPLDRAEAEAMLAALTAGALLDGYRGGPVCDRAAVVDAILAFARLAGACAPAATVEINPLLATPQGCFALDALITPCGAQS